MAIQTINSNSVQPIGPPNTGSSTEMGDTWQTAVTKLNAMFVELYGASTYTGNKVFNGTITMQAGALATGTYFAPSGDLTTTVGVIGSSATNTTQTLGSYTLPANVLDAAGRNLEIIAWGNVAANAAPKTVRLLFGGQGFSTGTQTGNGYSWQLTGIVLKNTANSQSIRFTGTASGGALTMTSATDTSVDTSTIAITVTCADASAAQSNVLMHGFIIRYYE